MEPSISNFGHPYQPYQIQQDFMLNLYQTIESGHVGIFESPTGTGKSLSLICGALTWLRDHKRRALEDDTLSGNGSELDWLTLAENATRRRELIQQREDLEQRLSGIREAETQRRERQQAQRLAKKVRSEHIAVASATSTEDDFLLDEYTSDQEQTTSLTITASGFSSATQALLDRVGKGVKTQEPVEDEIETKIIFCSRTHSQLSQFVGELRKAHPPLSYSESMASGSTSESKEEIKHVPLGSRKNLCINTKVSKLSSTNAINERCLELQKSGVSKEQKCQYLQATKDSEQLTLFRDRVLAKIQDIEDIATLGRSMSVCPYYASRSPISVSEIITLPYPLLLQKSAREALGVSVKDNVVIVDEAHNLMDAIADTFSISMSLSQLRIALDQVTAYIQRFKAKLKGGNRVYLAQVLRLLNSMISCLANATTSTSVTETMVTAGQLLSGKGVDQIKPHKLIQYLHTSKLAFKVESYTMAQESVTDATTQQARKGLLMLFQNLLIALMNPTAEGRFYISKESNEVNIRYTLLDATEHFKDIVQDARAVILAGGTMSPMSDYADFLFSYVAQHQLRTFSFGHVIPPSNLFVRAIQFGPSMAEFDFTFQKRKSPSMIVELGRTLIRICASVPDGVVVFFPSYDYLSQVSSIWSKDTVDGSITMKLFRHKELFEETKTTQVEELLRQYAKAIDIGRGGLLLSVVGGKLSEGINFSDKLGRAVVAVGLPFPNPNGAEWKSKLEHVESTRYERCKLDIKMDDETARRTARQASRDFYENTCMRAVNQSIGRVIRHRHDFAAIILVDRRFTTERIRSKLPGWIQSSLQSSQTEKIGDLENGLRNFFADKQ